PAPFQVRQQRRQQFQRRQSAAEAVEARPAAQREERGERGRNGKRRRRGRGRGRRVYEVDGGEWLDFVSADLKHLTPRPERPRPTLVESEAEDDAPVEAEIIVHPAVETMEIAEPAPRAAPVREHEEVAAVAMADAEPAMPEPEPLNYEPDQERRDKFFSRLSRWAKK
ncbi:MAG: hypothetical protein J0L81_18380, partial [Caulobacterales bacterium]|nr:hypothetical protein [Caulobacterales bacterium]